MSIPLSLEDNNKPTISLESVKLDFLSWRRDPHRSGRIPEPFWDNVIQLLSSHRKSKVLSALGISHAQLTQKLKRREQSKPSMRPPLNRSQQTTAPRSFIQAVVIEPLPLPTHFDVMLTKPNGSTLHIQTSSQDTLLKLTEQFMG
jgi:hypothetical protein